MPFVPAICTQCGAPIVVDDTKDAGICNHCGTAFITEKAIYNYNYVNNTTNITNTNNTYNVQDSEVHIHSQYDDAETLYKNICGLLERGYATNSEAVTNNLKTLEEKFPLDERTDKAKWLCLGDEEALMRVRQADRAFFYQYADEIKDEHKIVSFLDFDEALFERNVHKLQDELRLLKNRARHPLIEKRYQEVVVGEGNKCAYKAFGKTFKGDMHDLKKAMLTLQTHLTETKNFNYSEVTEAMFRASAVKLAYTEKKFGVDVEYLEAILDWFIEFYQQGYKHLPTQFAETVIAIHKDLPVDKQKSFFHCDVKELEVRTGMLADWSKVVKTFGDGSDKMNVRLAYSFLHNAVTPLGKNAHKYPFTLNVSIAFKSGFFGVKYTGDVKDMTVKAFVEKIGQKWY